MMGVLFRSWLLVMIFDWAMAMIVSDHESEDYGYWLFEIIASAAVGMNEQV
jgi:hypothetical protein